MGTNVEASRLLIHKAAILKDAHKSYTKAAAMAKSFASQTAMDAAIDCVQIFGGYGYSEEYPVARRMRGAKVVQIFEGSSQIQRLIISREMLQN